MRKFFVATGLLLAAMVFAAQTASAAPHRGHHAFGHHLFAGHARHYGARTAHRHFAFRATRHHGYSRLIAHRHHGRHDASYAQAAPLAPVAAVSQPTMTGFGLLDLGVVAPIQRVERSAGLAARSVASGVTQTVRRVVAGAQVGGASYYGGSSRTADGGHVGAATCAHRSLPFGTRVLVTNLNNSRQAVLTVNDRGPFVRGRIVDVSVAAAGTLGMLHSGTARVSLQVVGRSG